MTAYARRVGIDPLESMLYGGEDYVLLGTMKADEAEQAKAALAEEGLPMYIIGGVEAGEPGVVLLRAKGDLDAYTAPGLRARLHEATAEDAHVVVVDLAQITFIDSAGLGALVGAHRRMCERGGCLRIVRPPALVARAFELTGLDAVLDLRDDREQALAPADR